MSLALPLITKWLTNQYTAKEKSREERAEGARQESGRVGKWPMGGLRAPLSVGCPCGQEACYPRSPLQAVRDGAGTAETRARLLPLRRLWPGILAAGPDPGLRRGLALAGALADGGAGGSDGELRGRGRSARPL